MSNGSGAAAGGAERSFGQRIKRTVQSKVLVPLAATAVSAGVSYLAKKLPLIIEEKLAPKLRESGAPELAKTAEAVGAVLPGASSSDGEPQEQSDEQPQESSGSPEASEASNDEREAERREREKRRQERKRALTSA